VHGTSHIKRIDVTEDTDAKYTTIIEHVLCVWELKLSNILY